MRRYLSPAIVFALLAALAAAAFAKPECTDWVRQKDGSHFRTCVGDDGRQYCEKLVDRVATRVSCR